MTGDPGPGGLRLGDLLDGRYRLIECVGEGGMARVYRAEDVVLGRTVAIKAMRAALDDMNAVERAQSETTLLAALNHHALVTLYDAKIAQNGDSYLAMEFVHGITLRERIARGPLSSTEAAHVASEIGEALHVAHSAGIVHRDIKPSNVLLATSPVPRVPWRPKLADFGIAYLRDSTRVTTTGQVIGTIAYIAPEQADGRAPTPFADIYSLGILLIEALTGVRPFADAEGLGALVARMSSPVPVPDTLDERWQQLLRGMTARRPDDRPTALEVATTASSLAGGDSAPIEGRSAQGDEPTIAAAAGVPIAAAADPTSKTAVLPGHGDDATAHDSTVGPNGGRSLPIALDTAQTDRRRRWRVALIGGIAAAAVILLDVAGILAFPRAEDAAPTPTPSVSQTPAPADVETIDSPADGETTDTTTEPVDSGGQGSGNPGNGNGGGNGNGNSGNGNGNSGNGNGNSGNGNGNSGNGNGSPGNGNG